MLKSKPKIVQISNIAPQATKDQMSSLFGYLGKIEDIRLYPTIRDVAIPVQSRICFIKFHDRDNVGVSQHLTNTVFIDRALMIIPFTGEMPDEKGALGILSKNYAFPGLPNEAKWPPHITNHIDGIVLRTVDPCLAQHNLPEYPNLPVTTESCKVNEIRRTVVFDNINTEATPEEMLIFAEQAGEVKYLRMGNEIEGNKNCLVEYSEQSSIIEALKLHGMDFMDVPVKVNHSTVAIIKPLTKSNEAAQREIEEAMRRVKEAQNSLFSTNMDPLAFLDAATKEKYSHSRSRSRSRSRSGRSQSKSRHSKSRSRRRSRSHSRSRRHHSRSRKRSSSRHKKSRSRSRKRSRSRHRSGSKSKSSRSSKRDHDKDKRSRRSGSRDKKERRKDSERKEKNNEESKIDIIASVIEKELKKMEEKDKLEAALKDDKESKEKEDSDRKKDKKSSRRSRGLSRSRSRSKEKKTSRRSRSRSRRRSVSRSREWKPRKQHRSKSRSRSPSKHRRDRSRDRSRRSRSRDRDRKRSRSASPRPRKREKSRSRERRDRDRDRKDRDRKDRKKEKKEKEREKKESAHLSSDEVTVNDDQKESTEDKEETVDMDISNSP